MAQKLMYIPSDDIENYPFCRLQSWFKTFEPTNQNSMKVPKVVKPINKKKGYYKTLGAVVINSSMSTPCLNETAL